MSATDLFRQMIAAKARAFDLTYDRARTVGDAILEMQEHLGMLTMNDEDLDTRAAMLENLADLIAAAERMRDLLLPDVTEPELRATIEALRPACLNDLAHGEPIGEQHCDCPRCTGRREA